MWDDVEFVGEFFCVVVECVDVVDECCDLVGFV